jgi:hypothetical protein
VTVLGHVGRIRQRNGPSLDFSPSVKHGLLNSIGLPSFSEIRLLMKSPAHARMHDDTGASRVTDSYFRNPASGFYDQVDKSWSGGIKTMGRMRRARR